MCGVSMGHIPELSDLDRPRSHAPRYPAPATHPSFPQAPPSQLDSASVFGKMGVDTLFFAFYYQQGTYHQYLAAKELRSKSWRFHENYRAWFQRHDDPTVRYRQHAARYCGCPNFRPSAHWHCCFDQRRLAQRAPRRARTGILTTSGAGSSASASRSRLTTRLWRTTSSEHCSRGCLAL